MGRPLLLPGILQEWANCIRSTSSHRHWLGCWCSTSLQHSCAQLPDIPVLVWKQNRNAAGTQHSHAKSLCTSHISPSPSDHTEQALLSISSSSAGTCSRLTLQLRWNCASHGRVCYSVQSQLLFVCLRCSYRSTRYRRPSATDLCTPSPSRFLQNDLS